MVRLIDRFPVQRPSAANQPQPESGLRPKAVPAERLLSLRQEGGDLSVWCADRSEILSGELLLIGATGRVSMGEGLGEYLVAWRETEAGLAVVFAGAQAVDSPGELMRLYGVGPGGIELARADFNDGQIAGTTTAAVVTRATPLALALYPAWPNPFNPETTIGYALPAVTEVELSVYDALGQRVRVLVSGTKAAGVHQVTWDGRGQTGEAVGTGVYFCRLQAGDQVQVRRMVLLK